MTNLAVHDLDLSASTLTFDLQRFAEEPPAAEPPAASEPPAAEPPAASEPPAAEPPAATEPPPAAEPIKYEFTLPEGVIIDPEIDASLQTTLNELKIPKDKAQGLIDLQLKVVEKQQKAVAEYVAKETAETEAWLGSGTERSKKEENIGRGKLVLDPTGELMQLFDSAQLGNNKLLAQALDRLGATSKEGTFVPAPPGGEKSWAEVMYKK